MIAISDSIEGALIAFAAAYSESTVRIYRVHLKHMAFNWSFSLSSSSSIWSNSMRRMVRLSCSICFSIVSSFHGLVCAPTLSRYRSAL